MSSNGVIAGKRSERGSALLIVFLFAAVIAIMLYREMPVSAFEAQRQKEQLLIDRGQEYKRAVKLYYIKLGSYPSSIDQLESTNRMRFLRHRFKDPFTGKDDWRLLHMGPGGMLLDSKVNPLKTGDQNGTSFAGNNTGIGASSSGTTFGGSTNNNQQTVQTPVNLGQPMAYMTPGQPVVYHNYPGGIQGGPAVPTAGRAPAIPANGGQQRNEDGPDPSLNDSDSSAITSQNGMIEAGVSQNNGAGQNPAQQTAQGQGLNAQNGMNMLGPGSVAQQSGAATQANMPQRVSPAMMAVQNLLQQGNQPNTSSNSSSTFGSTSNAGRLNNGGLAGVASKIEGRGIKVVEDQSDYSKWEFYYDPRKDTVSVMNTSNSGGVQVMNDPNHASGPFNVAPVSPNGQVPANANTGTTSNGNSFGPGVFGPPIPAQGQMPVPIQTIPPQQQQPQQQQPQQDQQQQQ